MTARLILCPPTAAALDRLNDCREVVQQIAAELRKKDRFDHSRYRALLDRQQDVRNAFVDSILAGAVYVDDTDQDQTCQFPRCTAWATHRSVTSAGYKQTCGEHVRWDETILPAQETPE